MSNILYVDDEENQGKVDIEKIFTVVPCPVGSYGINTINCTNCSIGKFGNEKAYLTIFTISYYILKQFPMLKWV